MHDLLGNEKHLPPQRVSLRRIRRLLVANGSAITIRVFRAATELGTGTVAISAEQDKRRAAAFARTR